MYFLIHCTFVRNYEIFIANPSHYLYIHSPHLHLQYEYTAMHNSAVFCTYLTYITVRCTNLYCSFDHIFIYSLIRTLTNYSFH